MIILSQDKTRLLTDPAGVEVWHDADERGNMIPQKEGDPFEICALSAGFNVSLTIGKYATIDRAKEIILEIRDAAAGEWGSETIYEMPKI